MKKSIRLLMLALGLLISTITMSSGQVVLSLDDPLIKYDGAFYSVVTPTLVTFNRHDATVYNNTESGIYGAWIRQWVITQTGVRVRFKTSSPTINFTFQQRASGGTIGSSPTNGFSVYADSVLIGSHSSLLFTVTNPNPGSATFYEITLPNLWAVDLIGMELEDTYALEDPSINTKPIYVALGDSKTHGTGQYVSTAKTYPFLLSKLMKWDLYNMAVAGSSTGWAMALNVKNKQVDYVTIEFGFNDWKYLTESLSSRQTQYERLIDSLRLYQPNATIYCITPIVSTDNSGVAPYTLAEFRTMVASIVTTRIENDSKLFLIPGPAISSASMLASGDPVHLSESGAATLATNLKNAIDDPSSITALEDGQTKMDSKFKINTLNSSTMEIAITESGYYAFDLYSLEGKSVAILKDTFLTIGKHKVHYQNTSNLNSVIVQVKFDKNVLGSQVYYINRLD